MKKLFTLSSKYITGIFLLFSSTINIHAASYYWVGGSGNWNELTHWATTSGGSVNHVEIPTANDDVFFDANSFTSTNQTVNINSLIAYCHNMDWSGATGNPSITGSSINNLKVFGSLKLISAMDYSFSGILVFAAAGSESITTNGKALT